MVATRPKVLARSGATERRWLVLFHHLPPKPDYLRVKVGRQLRGLGALALKNSVYVLPNTPRYRDGIAAVAREILERGGDAIACEARLVAGLSDAVLEDRFREARNTEYAAIAEAAKRLAASLVGAAPSAGVRRRRAAREWERLRRRFDQTLLRDPFGAGARDRTAGLLSLVEDRLQGVESDSRPDPRLAEPPNGATWVTRTGVMVDRTACAWLIRRFIDRSARFKFVTGGGYRPERSEIRFDMAGAEFGHDGNRCTFEVLLDSFRLRDSALVSIGEIVHDLDLEDSRFGRPETAGVGRMIIGIALNTADDTERLKRGAALFDGLYQSFRQHGHAPSGRTRVARTGRRSNVRSRKGARRATS